jgi:hypothetical protein
MYYVYERVCRWCKKSFETNKRNAHTCQNCMSLANLKKGKFNNKGRHIYLLSKMALKEKVG